MTQEAIIIQMERINKNLEEIKRILSDIRGNTRGYNK